MLRPPPRDRCVLTSFISQCSSVSAQIHVYFFIWGPSDSWPRYVTPLPIRVDNTSTCSAATPNCLLYGDESSALNSLFNLGMFLWACVSQRNPRLSFRGLTERQRDRLHLCQSFWNSSPHLPPPSEQIWMLAVRSQQWPGWRMWASVWSEGCCNTSQSPEYQKIHCAPQICKGAQ